MLGSTFYHQTIRKYVAAFGTLFNDLKVERKNSGGAVVERVGVPLAYGPRQKWLLALRESIEQRKVLATKTPRMGFDPYNIDFVLYILVNKAEDGTQILEQILPYFTPEFTVTINTVPDMGIKADVPIVLNSASQTDEYEGDQATRRTIIWTLSFLMKGYVYPDIKTSAVIKTIEVNFRIPANTEDGDLVQDFVVLESTIEGARTSDYILLETGNYERILNESSSQDVGDATVKTRYTVTPSPTTATADTDYGFSETFEFFSDSKNFDPTTGEDFT